MLSSVTPQTGPSLVCTVVPAVHDGDAACAVAEAPPTAATVSPATRAAAAAMNATARSGRLLAGGEAGLILFHVIVNAPQTGETWIPSRLVIRSDHGRPSPAVRGSRGAPARRAVGSPPRCFQGGGSYPAAYTWLPPGPVTVGRALSLARSGRRRPGHARRSRQQRGRD